MRLLTPAQALELDRQTFSQVGMSSDDFIERAGAAVFRVLQELSLLEKRILILAGPGHNGDDGRALALRLPSAQIFASDEVPNFEKFEVVVDALLGVGLSRPLSGEYLKIVSELNKIRDKKEKRREFFCVVSVDLPTGLNSLTGWPNPVAVRAHHTVTMQAAKPGFFQNEGPLFTGRLWIAKLPYPSELFRSVASTHFAFGRRFAQKYLPKRPFNSNKSTFGSLNVVAGSAKYPGASVLTARAALRCGVGSVRLIQFENIFPEWFEIPETLFEHWSEVPLTLDAKKTWVVGPGLDDHEKTEQLIHQLKESGCEKVLLDATALEVLAKMKIKLPSTWLLTPHPKELGRLIGKSAEVVQQDRFAAVEEAQQKWGASLLLKGYKTVLHEKGKSFICLRGHSALAKAGSGDVLSGIIGALAAQGLPLFQSGMLGAALQGLAADGWLEKGDAAAMTPSDLIDLLPAVQSSLR